MKTKFTKRMLSIVLALLMVITTMPITAISAFAATDDNLIAHYFVHDATTNEAGKAPLSSVSESAVTWDRTENAAHFLGSKSETPVVNIGDLTDSLSNANGITITFDAKTEDNGWSRFFELSTSNPYGDGSSTYLYAATKGYSRIKNMTYGNSETGNDEAIFPVNANQWHNYKFVVGSGRLIVFVDGVRTKLVEDKSRISDTFFANLVNSGKLMIGASSYNDDAFTGYIKNFTIVKMATLDIAKAAYEDKMANGAVYTNMLPAYESYVTLCKYSEELTYNNFEHAAQVPAAAADLLSKTDAMGTYSFTDDRSITNGRYAGFADNNTNDFASGTNYSTYMRNVLYGQTNRAGDADVVKVTGYGCGKTQENVLTYPEITLLYDGSETDLDVPTLVKYYVNKTGLFPTGAFVENSELKLVDDYWQGTDTKDNWAWLYSKKPANDRGNISANKSIQKRCSELSKGTWYRFANMFRVTKKPSNTEYLLEIVPEVKAYSSKSGNKDKLYTSSDYNTTLKGMQPIRVINYVPVINATAKVAGIQDISKYTQGGARSYITAVSNLVTKLNDFSLGKYFNGSTNNYSECSKAIKEIAEVDTTNISSSALSQDTFRTITAKHTDGKTIGTFKLSNGATANTVKGALNTVTPSQNRDADFHYDYVWNNVVAVSNDATYTVTEVPEAHDFVDDDVITEATCETAGEKNVHCEKCEYPTTATIPAKTHKYGDFEADWENYVEGTETYTHTKVCANDESHKITDNCTFTKWEQQGDNDVRTCTVCNESQTRPHQADKVTVTFQLPNGTVISDNTVDVGTVVDAPVVETVYDVEGHHAYHFAEVSYTITEDVTITAIADEVVAHTTATKNTSLVNVDAETLLANSCNESRTYSYVQITYCSDENCNVELDRETITVDPLEHTINEESIKQSGSEETHNVECTVCHKVTATPKHSYKETVNDATCTAFANIVYECECGYSYTEFTGSEYAPHSFGEYIYNGDNTHTRICSECSFEATDNCNIVSDITEATCTEPAYNTTHCTLCSNQSAKVSLNQLTELHSIEGGSGSYFTVQGNKSGTNNNGTFEKDLEYNVSRMEIQIESRTGVSNSTFTVYDYKGNAVLTRKNNGNQTDTVVLENTRGYFRIEYNMYGSSSDSHLNIQSIKVINSAHIPLGHTLSWRTTGETENTLGKCEQYCTRCGHIEKTQDHNVTLSVVNGETKATCSTCGLNKTLSTQKDTYRITTGNIFDFDSFADAAPSSSVNNGAVIFNKADGSATLIGKGDNYTSMSPTAQGTYYMEVEPGASYTMTYESEGGKANPFVFAVDDQAVENRGWTVLTSGASGGTFTVPSNVTKIYIRLGSSSGEDELTFVNYRNFTIYKNDGSYAVLNSEPVASGTTFADAIAGETTSESIENFCHWNVADDATVTSNKNVSPVLHIEDEIPAVAPTCTETGLTAGVKCSVCETVLVEQEEIPATGEHSYTGESVYTPADGDANGYTEYHCVNGCNELGGRVYDEQDWDAYDATVTESEDLAAKTAKYTAASIADYQAAVNAITDTVNKTDDSKSQSYIDSKTAAIKEAASLLKLNAYDVTFNVVINDEITHTETLNDVAYGTSITLDAKDHMPADSFIYKWTASDDNGDSNINSSSTKVSYVIYDKTSVNCYVTEEKKATEDLVKVTLIDKSNHVTGVAYVASGSTFAKTVNGNELSVDGQILTAPKYPYYQIKEFRLADSNTIITDNGYQVTEDIVVTPVYTAEAQIVISTVADDVTINKEVRSTYTAKWDQTITVYNENATAWYANGVLVATGNTYKFQATQSVEITYDTVTVTEGKSRIDYAKYESEFGYSRIVVSNCVPQGAKVVEQGIKILTSSKQNVPSVASSKVIAGTKKFVASKTTDTGLQFMFTLTTDDAVNTIAVVSFVTYELNGETKTVWSSEGDTSATMIYKTNA